MPRFFFDVQDDRGTEEDRSGLDLSDAEDARREALAGLLSIARHELRPDRPAISVVVRDGQRTAVLTASLVLSLLPGPVA